MKKITLLLVIGVLAALLGLAACAPVWGQPAGGGGMMGSQGGGVMGGQGGGVMGGQGGGVMGGQGGGMMGGQGGGVMGGQGGGVMGPQQSGQQPPQGQPYTNEPAQPYPYRPGDGIGPEMMGDGGVYRPDAEQITIDKAAEAAERYLNTHWQDLALAEVMEFAWNFYAEVEEEATGLHAMELLIDRYTSQVYPETGPNMVWNTRYGMMGNYYQGNSTAADMPVTPEQAKALARQFLEAYPSGLTVADADTFYGYYTLHTLKDGQVEGMLSVNGYTGAVWYHDWHGSFIQMKDMSTN